MAYFPFFVDIKDKKCVIFGGGQVSYRKVEALLEFNADITVIAPIICDELYLRKDKIHIIEREYRSGDLETAFFVIAATDDAILNQTIANECRIRKLLINTVDELQECDFIFPSYIKRGDITIGVTTSGKSPVMARYIRKTIDDNLQEYHEDLVDSLGLYRDYVKKNLKDGKKRAAVFYELAELGIDRKGRITQEDVDALIQKQIEIEK